MYHELMSWSERAAAHDLEHVRRQLEREAAALARPRLWPDTIGALATTAWRVAATAAPEAPFHLLSAAAAASGLPIAPPQASERAIDGAQRLVRAGGPTYIKLGQFIASADGLLPPEWVRAFAWCRDDAPPLPDGVARAVVDRELGADAGLAWFDERPLAAGSIGQVHRARLADGRAVVVKVRRPGLRRRLRSDVEALALAAVAAQRLHPAVAAANLPGFIELFAQLALQELDFRLEALNLTQSTAIFAARGLDYVRIPQPLDGLVTERVLVMEEVAGVSYDKATLATPQDGERLLQLAIRGVLETTILDGLFHGDLHAGNVLLDADGGFALVDFGICGRFDDRQRAGLVRYLLAFAAGDAEGQVRAMQHFGAIPPDADVRAIGAQLQVALDRLDSRVDGAVTFDRLGDTLGRLLRVLAANGFAMPKDLVLFFKNLLYLGSFAAAVAPRTDLFAQITALLGAIGEEHGAALAALLADGDAEAVATRAVIA